MADLTPKAFDGMVLEVVAIPLKGNSGDPGGKGDRGDPGKNNYQLWLEAGNTGSLEDFLEWSKGEDGLNGRPMVSRGRWEVGEYNPGEFVVAQGTATTSSLWFVIGDMPIISNVPPRLEAPGVWSQAPLPAGEPGTKWVILSGPPDLGDGDVGDYYLNLDTGDIYGPKTEASWGDPIGNLAGEDSAVLSVNGMTGAVNITLASLGAASAAQGALAESALQSDDVAPVAISGSYADLANKPTLGTAASKNENYFVVSDALGVTVAQLVNGVVPASQLPSYVDDVLEFANLAAFPATGEKGKIYVTEDTNLTYRWTGSGYIEISKSPGSTDSIAEGSTNLYFTSARAAAAAPVQSVNGKTGTFNLTASDVGAQPLSTSLTNLAAVTNSAGGRALLNAGGAANTFPYFSAANTVGAATITAFGRSLIDDADAATARATLGAVGLTGAESVAGVKTFSDKPIFAAGARLGLNQMMEFGDGSSVYGSIRPTSQGTMVIAAGPVGAAPGPRLLLRPRGDAVATGQVEITTNGVIVLDSPAAIDGTKRGLGMPITISATAPTSPQEGDVWIDIS